MTTKKELRKEQFRLEILQTAEKIFARQGYHTSTMEMVAEECGWSKGTLYLYFKSKEDLFFSILFEKMDQFSATLLPELRSSENIDEMISALVNSQFSFFSENKSYFQLALAEQGKVMHTSDSGLREKMMSQQSKRLSEITEVFSLALPKCCSIEPNILVASIMGAINLQLVGWIMSGEGIDLESTKTQITKIFINGIKCDE